MISREMESSPWVNGVPLRDTIDPDGKQFLIWYADGKLPGNETIKRIYFDGQAELQEFYDRLKRSVLYK